VDDEELAPYVEDVAIFFEETGLPRIAGRILGLLMVCDPPHRSAAELVDELGVSKGSVSTMTRMLLLSGLVERVGVPGERATYFALKDDGFEKRFELLMHTVVGFRPLAERGLELLADADVERTHRLRSLRALYGFLEREMPAMIDKWRRERERLIEEEP
jgi:DNA-binding MarR family transcriptional regulator